MLIVTSFCVQCCEDKPPRWPGGWGAHLKSRRSGVRIPLAPGFFRGRVIPVTYKLALQWLPCQAPGITVSVLGLVGLVSVYCDWVRWKVWSVTPISVWQHLQLSEQIRPWDTHACCWDVKQATNQLWGHFRLQTSPQDKKRMINTNIDTTHHRRETPAPLCLDRATLHMHVRVRTWDAILWGRTLAG